MGDLGADAGVGLEIGIASLAGEEAGVVPGAAWDFQGELFGVGDWADEFQSEAVGVLELAPEFHFEAGDADRRTPRREATVLGSVSGVARDHGLGVKFLNDEPKDLLAIIDGVCGDGLRQEAATLQVFLKKRDEHHVVDEIGRLSDFVDGEFGERVGNRMVAVAPEGLELFLKGLGEVNPHAESGVWVSLRGLGFIESVLNGSLGVVLPDVGQDVA